jgi:hypothetical protein
MFLLAGYPVDGALYRAGGLEPLSPALGVDRPPIPLLAEIAPAGRLPACSRLRLTIEEAPLFAILDVNPLDGWVMFAVAFPICLLAGSIVPNPRVLESRKWFETNLECPLTKKFLWKSRRQKNPGNQNRPYQNGYGTQAYM